MTLAASPTEAEEEEPISSSGAMLRVGRYVLYDEIASGGMASVHLGRLMGSIGFARTVAIKRLHPQFAKDGEFVRMFLDEAHVAARLRHPNVVPILDVVHTEDELFLVMDYVEGESLSRLFRLSKHQKPIPIPIAVGIISGVLNGLHAAHEARNDAGEPLHLVHRDVSPQNVIVGADGVPRVLDFGIAKARGNVHQTTEGQLKGKIAYMAPEQIGGDDLDRHADIYAAGVVLWELLTQSRLFRAKTETLTFARALKGVSTPPSRVRADTPSAVDDVVMTALSMRAVDRFATARAFALALEAACPAASASQIGRWVEETASSSLARRAGIVASVESQPGISESADSTSESLRMKISGTNPRVVSGHAAGSVSGATESVSSRDTIAASRTHRTSWSYLLLAVAILCLATVLFSTRAERSTTSETHIQPSPTAALAGEIENPLPVTEAVGAPADTENGGAVSSSAPAADGPREEAKKKETSRARPWRRPVAAAAPVASAASAAEPAPPAAKPAAAKPLACDPPFYIDAKGIQRIKKNCL